MRYLIICSVIWTALMFLIALLGVDSMRSTTKSAWELDLLGDLEVVDVPVYSSGEISRRVGVYFWYWLGGMSIILLIGWWGIRSNHASASRAKSTKTATKPESVTVDSAPAPESAKEPPPAQPALEPAPAPVQKPVPQSKPKPLFGDVYEHPQLGRETVKRGFIWPALFVFGWAFYKKMWALGFALVGVFWGLAVIFVFVELIAGDLFGERSGVVLAIKIVDYLSLLGLMVLTGFNASKWRGNHLIKKGYRLVPAVHHASAGPSPHPHSQAAPQPGPAPTPTPPYAPEGTGAPPPAQPAPEPESVTFESAPAPESAKEPPPAQPAPEPEPAPAPVQKPAPQSKPKPEFGGVYEHPHFGRQVVKRGFTWPAFFFTWIWAFAKGMPAVGFALLGGYVLAFLLPVLLFSLVGLALVDEASYAAGEAAGEALGESGIVKFIIWACFLLGVPLIAGFKASKWRGIHLRKKGYKWVKATEWD